MSTPGPQHDRWADSVGPFLLGALPPDEREGFLAHLDECVVCRHDVEELAVAAEALPLSVPSVTPPPALKERIMTVVDSEAELLAAAGEDADAPRRPPAPARPRRRFFAGLLPRPAIALASAVVLLVAGAVGGALLSAGEGTSTVAGTTTLQGASAELEVSDDASTLVARNVPEAPRGESYQVWLKRPGVDAPEPTSVLWTPRSDGSATVAVPSDGDVEAVLVTREPRGGSDTPSENPVITIPLA
jgi:Anti-sigma-K factor rskA/Putative zinc-finger